mmetsp:Transcript_57810/g.137649  ORF Transcript_57810/g.137649 Transcript_57810/m.137649 type:complete len:218 (-) Transcript_57810:763-1416(-)
MGSMCRSCRCSTGLHLGAERCFGSFLRQALLLSGLLRKHLRLFLELPEGGFPLLLRPAGNIGLVLLRLHLHENFSLNALPLFFDCFFGAPLLFCPFHFDSQPSQCFFPLLAFCLLLRGFCCCRLLLHRIHHSLADCVVNGDDWSFLHNGLSSHGRFFLPLSPGSLLSLLLEQKLSLHLFFPLAFLSLLLSLCDTHLAQHVEVHLCWWSIAQEKNLLQ